ncbi:polysaccharide deacetylase family protein [Phenylobacterium sp.]|uniref:polysaccharide deacetylase family protein n=1 Tax=Phenylobacterium sp. TaxID=1871053 RepID=UPI003983C6AD
MALDPDYLRYPMRRYGMDHDRYDWSILPVRPKVSWPGGASIALWINVALEFFPLDQKGQPFKLPGGMVTPYPDLRHFTLRDYGNRVGVYRLLQLLDQLKLRASWAINSRVAERYPSLVRSVVDRGDEVVGHGLDMDHPHYGGQPEAEERAVIRESLSVLRQTTGQPVRGWISPGKSESMNTPDLLAEEGVEWFGDWINDDMPYVFRTRTRSLVALPHSSEISDRQIIVDFRHSESDFADQVVDQFNFLHREAQGAGGRIMAITLHPWVIGQPHRIGALERALKHIQSQPGVWSASGEDLVEAWTAAQPAGA